MKNTRRILSFFLVVALLFALCPAIVQAENEDQVCPCCNKTLSSINWTKYSKWTNTFSSGSMFSKSGHYKLDDSFTMKKEYTITANVVLDFNGLKLQAKSGSRGFVVKSGGTLTLVNTGGSNGRLEGHNTSDVGGAIKVEAGGTLNILSGRVVGTSMSYDGGAIYNEGTLNMSGGTVESGKANGKAGGNICNKGVFYMSGGTVKNGEAKHSGNVHNNGTMVLSGGTISGGTVTGDNGYGGNIYNNATLTMTGGTITDGTSDDHGGNLFATGGSVTYLNGGTIKNGKVLGVTDSTTSANGGNIYATGAASTFEINGTSILDGKAEYSLSNGGNMMLNSGIQVYMYSGTISGGTANNGNNLCVSGSTEVEGVTQYSGFYMMGGTLDSGTANGVKITNANNKFVIYSGRYTGTLNVPSYAASCACYTRDDTGYDVWNSGYKNSTCTDCIYAQALQAGKMNFVSGSHDYKVTAPNTFVCNICGTVTYVENMVATVLGEPYDSLEKAVEAAPLGETVYLQDNTSAGNLALYDITLDLNGYTLQANALSSVGNAHIIDTSAGCNGRLVSDSVTFNIYNSYLPVHTDTGIAFCALEFDQWLERVDEDTTKVKLRFTQKAAETLVDEAFADNASLYNVGIVLTWTDDQGAARTKDVAFGDALLNKYAEKWDGRVFVATIKGAYNVTDLTCSYVVVSFVGSGAGKLGTTLKNVNYIGEKLTWDAINSFDIKTSDMTVEEMRQLVLDFMVFNKTYQWTPDESVSYIRNASGSADHMDQGTVYGALPYVGVASGNVYRMMDYIDPNTGLLDMKKALPALGTKDQLAMSDLKYFGSQCSQCVYWAWGRVINSVNYQWTSNATPYNNFIILGDVAIPDSVKTWNTTYGTDECVAENGEQVMYTGYAALQKADGLVYYTTAGHLIMAATDAYVVYNDDGTINGEQSYIYIHDQGQSWENYETAGGSTIKIKGSVSAKKTFKQLFSSNYIPFTFAEFVGQDDIEETEVSLVSGDTTYVSGTIDEKTGIYNGVQTTDSLTWSQIFSSTVQTNYGVVDAYIIVTDNRGNELYRHAVRVASAGRTTLKLVESGEMVTTWVNRELTPGKTYKMSLEVQLSTGERPVIWSGALVFDK